MTPSGLRPTGTWHPLFVFEKLITFRKIFVGCMRKYAVGRRPDGGAHWC